MIDVEIRNKLAQYLASAISLRAFQEWFVPLTWDIQNTQCLHVLDLVYGIELKIAEYTNGHLSEDDLRQALSPMVESYTVNIAYGAQATQAVRTFLTNSQQVFHQTLQAQLLEECA